MNNSDSTELLNKYKSHLEKQKKFLEEHQNYLLHLKENEFNDSNDIPSPINNAKESQNIRSSLSPENLDLYDRSNIHHDPLSQRKENVNKYSENKNSKKRNLDSEIREDNPLSLSTKGQQFLLERERKLEEMRRAREKLLESEVYDTPRISERTRWIVEKKRQNYQKKKAIEDELMEKEFKRRQSLFFEAERKYALENPGTPKITVHAANLIREGSVTDRLFEMASKLKEKKHITELETHLKENLAREGNLSDSTRNIPVFIDLLNREEKRRQKQSEQMEKLAQNEKKLHKPKINPVSLEIASRLPSSSKERLLAPKPQRSEFNDLDDPNCSFRPSISQRSKEIEAEKEINSRRIERLLLKERRRKEKIESLRMYQEEKELEECTFNPKTSNYTKHISDKILPFNERAQQWQQNRESRIAEKRKDLEEKEMEKCTFHPKISNQEENEFIQISSYNSQLDEQPLQPSGFEQFINRQKKARQIKENLQNGSFVTGEKWSNRITIPKAFKLGPDRQTHNPIPSKHHIFSPIEIKKAVHKEIEKISTSFEESPGKRNSSFEENYQDISPQEISFEETYSEKKLSPRSSKSSNHNTSSEIKKDRIKQEINHNLPIEHIPPQGLFSVGGTLSILQGLNFIYA